jgi:hypothetical protein
MTSMLASFNLPVIGGVSQLAERQGAETLTAVGWPCKFGATRQAQLAVS